jgi:transposase
VLSECHSPTTPAWAMPILNYFKHPITNAYPESFNSRIRAMNRLGRGYSFEVLRAKILFSEGAHKHNLSRPKFERKPVAKRTAEPVMYGLIGTKPTPEPKPYIPKSTEPEKPEKDYGADISAPICMIEDGEP